jgi:hypothetical protein
MAEDTGIQLFNETSNACVMVCIYKDYTEEGMTHQDIAMRMLRMKPSVHPWPGTLHNVRGTITISRETINRHLIMIYKHSDKQLVLIDTTSDVHIR